MEHGAHLQVDAGKLEQVTPDVASEHRITVADNGLWNAMEPDNLMEERLGHGRGGVGVAQGYKMGVL